MATDTDLTFASIVDMVRGKSNNDQILSALDHTAGLLLILTPAALGPAAAPALALLEPKNELLRHMRSALDSLTTTRTDSEFTRIEVLSAAYCILSYSAFFEALELIRTSINRGLKLSARDRERIAASAAEKAAGHAPDSSSEGRGLLEYQLNLPHPAIGLSGAVQQLTNLYTIMSEHVRRLVRDLAIWDQATGATRDRLDAAISGLPQRASKLFSEQYLRLCVQFDEFAIWANLGEHELTRRQISQMSKDVQSLLKLRGAREDIDVGLRRLGEFCEDARRTEQDRQNAAIRDLASRYQASVREPIIVDDFEGDSETQLRYPSKLEAFVPQGFKVLQYERGIGPIEDERLWQGLNVREDIGSFLLTLFSSPYSERSPVVALGHPGSGKSLLTEVLAAQMATSDFTPFRVELRDVNADSEIQTQIEEQVRRDTGRETSWVDISEHCRERPPLIILDGYDELLQASGRVFSTYLTKVAQFQNREASLNRSVRVLVTSRITLIDKAEVPRGTTFVRLEEFDEARKSAWIERWNAANAPYFDANQLRPFALPNQTQIQSLASQPLLLLMLALFDSANNGLIDAEHLSRSTLYDTLLRRFIIREKSKGEQGLAFRSASPSEQTVVVNREMRRLGVAAIGMFNRRSLHLSQQELETDISFFETGVTTSAPLEGVALSQADLLLGSFFFVHESRSRTLAAVDGELAEQPNNTAFEFLHNTFGEFLTAHMILTELIAESNAISAMQNEEALKATLLQRLESPNGLPRTLMASLMCTPLITRPIVVAVLREWSQSVLDNAADRTRFEEAYVLLYKSVTDRILLGGPFPDILSSSAHPYPTESTLEVAATLTLNLTLVGTAISNGFEPGLDIACEESQITPWERLTYLWRSAFGMSGLDALGQIVETRSFPTLRLHLRDSPEQIGSDPLERLYTTSSALDDRVIAGLAAWALQDVWSNERPPLSIVARSGSTLDGSLLAQEAARRELIREALSTRRNDRDAMQQLASSRGVPSRSSADVPHSALIGMRGEGSLAFTPDVVLGLAPELTRQLWRRATDWETVNSWQTWSRRDVRSLIKNHPSTAADILATSFSPASGAYGYRSVYQLDFLRDFNRYVSQVVTSSRPSLPSVVAIEYISSARIKTVPPEFVERHLGRRADPWAIASRPSSTLRRLLDVTKQYGVDHWVRAIVSELNRSGGQDSGPRMLLELGMSGALSILRYAVENQRLDDSHRGLGGILPWMFGNLETDDPVFCATISLRLVGIAPDWIVDDVTAERVLQRFGLEEDGSYEGWVSQQVASEIQSILTGRTGRSQVRSN